MTNPYLDEASGDTAVVAPGSVIEVRDEEWLVTGVSTVTERDPHSGAAASHSEDGATRSAQRIEAQGLSELVRDTSAVFLDSIDRVTVLDPAAARLVNDDSAQYRDSRLWLEATLRKTPLPAEDQRIALAQGMLIDPKDYQLTPVRRILHPDNLRPRLLLADAVGLGKTIEIGLILAELIRRGRGERILIVTPKHVLEQMQHEMWTKFAIPFVRLDSEGIAAIRRSLPPTRNPFTYYKRAIISIDTLKSDRYLAHLRRHRWDAVVIDESHNVTNTGTLNNRLSQVLAQNTDALILASATPHNGRRESFAELIRLLEPTAISPSGDVDRATIDRLVVRRHRYSADVAAEVGTQWVERAQPIVRTVAPSAEEGAIAVELDSVWLHPRDRYGQPASSPSSGRAAGLFPWSLAKAFLSSPQALLETVENRLRTLGARLPEVQSAPEGTASSQLSIDEAEETQSPQAEAAALTRLRSLAQAAISAAENARAAGGSQTGKYGALLEHLRSIGVGRRSETRAVVFAERVATLHALVADLRCDMGLREEQVELLHGGMSDIEQQRVVEDFKRQNSPVRVLVTGDVASEGVNLHSQCHHLVHFDLPWSLIRIEQRNGRIDRYGQTHAPQITTLVLDPQLAEGYVERDAGGFSGDIRVLQRLIEKEDEAHRALGDAAALMGSYSVTAEEDAIRDALSRGQDLDTVMAPVEEIASDPFDFLMGLGNTGAVADDATAQASTASSPVSDAVTFSTVDAPAAPSGTGFTLYADPVSYLHDALHSIYPEPSLPAERGGVEWEERPDHGYAELAPPDDLRARLTSLPASYVRERGVQEKIRLATTQEQGKRSVAQALHQADSTSLWPVQHYLGPLHPVLEWADDRALAAVPNRNSIYAVRAEVASPTVVLHSQLTNRRGQSVSSIFSTAEFHSPQPGVVDPAQCLIAPHASIEQLCADLSLGRARSNSGDIDLDPLQPLIAPAVRKVTEYVDNHVKPAAAESVRTRVQKWQQASAEWQSEASGFVQTSLLRSRRSRVSDEAELIEQMSPERMITRPLLLVVPLDHPAARDTASTGGRR